MNKQAAESWNSRRRLFEFKLGFALLKDARLPIRLKAIAVLSGLLITVILELVELPFEAIFAGLLPMIGIPGDIAIDGIEVVAGPIIFACLILPFLAPRSLVEKIRSESAKGKDQPNSPIIDI